MRESVLLPVEEASQVGEARRLATRLARDLGFSETETGNVAIVVSEAGGNLAKYAKGGELLLRRLEHGGVMGIEVMALDRGPGVTNLAECLRNGYSTRGGPGTGLGAIARLSTLFDVHSIPGVGTAILCRLWSKPLPRSLQRQPLEAGAVCLPKRGEKISGDLWSIDQSPSRSRILAVDGLGHGPLAAEASVQTMRIFLNDPRLGPAAMVEAMHAGLRSTRGAAVGVAEVDIQNKVTRFAGVGNIAGVILSAQGSRNMVSQNGIVGHNVRRIQEFSYPWPDGGLLVMHSDGLAGRWSIDSYRGLASRHPSLIAGVLYRDFGRGRDDVVVVVAKERSVLEQAPNAYPQWVEPF
jgi:anti-sigma regulatory factor (Ser/Thr protein kinase)